MKLRVSNEKSRLARLAQEFAYAEFRRLVRDPALFVTQIELRVRAPERVRAGGKVLTRRSPLGRFSPARLLVLLILVLPQIQQVALAEDFPPRAAGGGSDVQKTRVGQAPQNAALTSAAADDLGDPLPDGAVLRLGTTRFQNPSSVSDLVLSPDEKTIVTVGKELIVWDATTGKERWRSGDGWRPPGASYGIRSVAFGPDGRFYIPGGQFGDVIRWDVSSRRRETLPIQFAGPSRERWQPSCRSVDVSRDGSKIAVGGANGVAVCGVDGKSILFQIANRPDHPLDFTGDDRLTFGGDYCCGWFSPDGKLLAVVASDQPKAIQLYDSTTGQSMRELTTAARPVRLAFSPNGRQIAATERDNAVRLYDVTTGSRLWSHIVKLTNIYENYTSAVAFSPDGKIVTVGATDYRIYLCDATTGKEIGSLTGHHWYPWTLAFTSDSKMLYSSGWDGTVRRWDVAGGKQLPPPRGAHATEVCAASPDGRTLAYADDLQTIHLVAAKGGSELRTINLADTEYSQLAFSPDGRWLAGGGSGGWQVRTALWNVATGVLIHRWDWPKGRDPHSTVESLSFTPDGTRLAAAVFRQSAVYVWNPANGESMTRLSHSQVYGLSFSPDGSTLATAGWDSTIRFWDTSTWRVRRQVKVDETSPSGDARMYAVCYDMQGGLIATAHLHSGMVRIWKAADMSLLTKFQVPGGFSYGSICFSPDGLWLAAGNSAGDVTLWDPLTGQMVWKIGRHEGGVYTLGFGRDNRTLLSGGEEQVCYLWNLWPGRTPVEKDPGVLWDDLIGTNGRVAYHAMWKLSEIPNGAVALLTDRTERLRNRSAHIMTSERSTAARRAVSLVAQIETPQAVRLLEDWAKDDRDMALGRFASAALRRKRAN
jgi:WD40 repeat protein